MREHHVFISFSRVGVLHWILLYFCSFLYFLALPKTCSCSYRIYLVICIATNKKKKVKVKCYFVVELISTDPQHIHLHGSTIIVIPMVLKLPYDNLFENYIEFIHFKYIITYIYTHIMYLDTITM